MDISNARDSAQSLKVWPARGGWFDFRSLTGDNLNKMEWLETPQGGESLASQFSLIKGVPVDRYICGVGREQRSVFESAGGWRKWHKTGPDDFALPVAIIKINCINTINLNEETSKRLIGTNGRFFLKSTLQEFLQW